ncbi:hypothetical protein [Nocardioides pinisoli]|uniref:HNH endonuclease n=1 Tax=Nocardioides pinisoli TaxID=2950279 RepID=A0ABT1L2A2_9ACTN|nr:hypothetical protein [Nocardioides pinisoli]MCP3422976.1 hypothetical protein [Nocardioides pinisoli]
MGKKNKGKGSAPRTTVGKDGRGKARSTKQRESAAPSAKRPPCDKCGQVHGRCAGHTKHGPNAGKPCGANPRAGALVCIKHGGNHPGQKKAAKERLLELVDPALAALHKVLTDPNTDDHNKVRAAQLVLDRTGFKPGMVIEVGMTKFDQVLADAVGLDPATGTVQLDRGHSPSALASGDHSWEDMETHATEAQAKAWAPYDDEDEPQRIDPDADTVPGEVVSILPEPPDTRGVPSEYDRGHTTAWPYGREPG